MKPALATTLLLLTATGCEISSSLGTAGAPENYQIRTVDPRGTAPQTVSSGDDGTPAATTVPVQLLVRLVHGDKEIRDLAVTDDHLYFATWWEGVYRLPKYGGELEVVEAGSNNLFEPLTTSRNEVFWVRTRFDKDDYPAIAIKRRADSGGPTSVLFSGDWGVTDSPQFQANARGLYMIAGRAGAPTYDLFHVPFATPSITPVLTLPVMWPSWRVDDEQLAFTECGAQGCSIVSLGLNDGQRRVLATLADAEERFDNPTIIGADAAALYLRTTLGLWRVDKQAGTVVRLFTGDSLGRFAARAVVDETRIYYTDRTTAGPALFALAKAGGPPTLVANGTTFNDPTRLVDGDQVLYILHDQGRQISVVAKP
jgi:hypothetical protein